MSFLTSNCLVVIDDLFSPMTNKNDIGLQCIENCFFVVEMQTIFGCTPTFPKPYWTQYCIVISVYNMSTTIEQNCSGVVLATKTV